jgi:branched-chain amino acid transport system ATP-binding protein
MILETEKLSKSFGGLNAVREVSITVRKGTIHSILGPNGAGKTTLFNLITGALPPSSGRVRLMGQDVTGSRPDALVYQGLARTFQRTSIFPSISAADNVALSLRSRKRLNAALKVPKDVASEIEAESRRILGVVGLAEHAHAPAARMSHGSQHALDIAIGLALSPQVLLMDEPLAGMSRGDRERIGKVIRSLRDDHGLTVLMVEHDVELVMRLSDTITVMQQGAVIAEDEPAAIKKSPAVRKAYLVGEFA